MYNMFIIVFNYLFVNSIVLVR